MAMNQRIYLDHSATTPVRAEVFDAMLPYLRAQFGNAGSVHSFGREARRAVDDARDQVAALVNAAPREILFTSGGTEADNLAVRGVVAASARGRKRVVVSAVEHHAVLHAAESLRGEGIEVVVVPVDSDGIVLLDALVEQITDDTVLVSIMHANNETGAVQPIGRIAALCEERGIVFHTDAVQSAGKLSIDVRRTPIGLLSISGHKLYAPKGVGACYVRKGIDVMPQAVGGGQERERRAGTENVAGIVGFGAACELARMEMQEVSARAAGLRDRLEREALAQSPDAIINAGGVERVPTISNIRFPGVDGESMVLALDVAGIAVSSGSACTAGSLDPSHVLLAMGQSYEIAQSAIRFSLGRETNELEIDSVVRALPDALQRARSRAS
ncbi:MAG: cysteine desulfurase family protein [Candidatus Hydrogenedentes bacterium]|nr:cysteine desulfurase family protein [Candidatus Hydrogenedentota bacterium]